MNHTFDALLEQTALWRGRDGRAYYVGELTDEHLGNVIAYLGRHAAELLAYRRDLEEHAEPPHDPNRALALECTDPTDWLLERPLYRRLLAEQRRRDSIDGEVVRDLRPEAP